jgi:dolichol-phosphate mannosyltransferase
MTREISVVIPTYNEVGSIPELIARIERALSQADWEVIVVDDNSPDGTYQCVRDIAANHPRVRVLRRVGRRGLSSACIDGMLLSRARFVAVIDADLQHDPALLGEMVAVLRSGVADLVVGSRYSPGGALLDWSAHREYLSRFATCVTRCVTSVQLSDPMSGYFALRREVFDKIEPRLHGAGFKILLDLILSADTPLRIRELAFTFGRRLHGQSKLTSAVAWQCATLLIEKLVERTLARHLPLARAGRRHKFGDPARSDRGNARTEPVRRPLRTLE